MIRPSISSNQFSTPRQRTEAFLRCALLLGCSLFGHSLALGQQYNPDLFHGMQWRLIGPHRGGRVTTVAGIPGRPAIYYMGTPGGGVWKTIDGGRVWKPIFDDAHVASIGALALAPSNPDVIYVGTGEQTEGKGVYKSIDGGVSWANIGLVETHYISSIIVDAHDPNIVIVGASGDQVPSQARGVFKTTDGGKTWNRTLFKDDRTGIMDMCADPADGRTIYAATLTNRFGPDEKQLTAPDGQIFKSTDNGTTWQALSGVGLPENFRGRIGVAVAPGDGRRVYAIMKQGFFRSDNAGQSWSRITTDPRVVGDAYFSRVFVDPRNADKVYVMQTSVYRSTDGGKTFEAYKGAPSGEDQHVLWIAPDDPQRMILGSDQGAGISVDEGRTWTSWFNQPTGQFYHVTTDNTFPYHVYAAQQDSGTVVVPNRSDFGQITYRDWFSAGGFESGYIAPDLANPNLIYSIGWFGTVLRMDRTTGQISTVFVPGARYRYTWETPLVFSGAGPKSLYVGTQHVLRTTDDAVTWQEISPDLTVKLVAPVQSKAGEPGKASTPPEPQRGVIQTIAPSKLAAGEIWVGTSNGLIQLTRDGGTTWKDVTPPVMPEHSHIILIEASPTDAETAYVTSSASHDSHPYIYRTRDAGATWQKIVAGLPEEGLARVVREDAAHEGLAYAGTETGVHVSFDGGEHWQPLQLNLPTTSVRDLAVHGTDLVAATFGRGLWILDDVSPFRQLDSKMTAPGVVLFRPEPGLRVRWDNSQETPLSVETPAGQNPPNGAVIDYYLSGASSKEIRLEIRDAHGSTVQRYSSISPLPDRTLKNAPDYWFAPSEVLPAKAGLNRFVWNLRFPHPDALPFSFYGEHLDYIEYTYTDDAIPGQTPRNQPQGPLAVPGNYEVVLSVDGRTYRQPLLIKLDPRVRVSGEDLGAQLDLATRVVQWMNASYKSYNAVASFRAALAERQKSLFGNPQAKPASDLALIIDKELGEIQNKEKEDPGFGSINRDLGRFLMMIESGDMRPAQSVRDGVMERCNYLKKDLAGWRTANAEQRPAMNKLLEQYRLAPLNLPSAEADPVCSN